MVYAGYKGKVMFVGISYDTCVRKYECFIEEAVL